MKNLVYLVLCLLLNFNLSAQNADINLLKNINLNRNQNLDRPFEIISKSVYPISLVNPIALIGIGLIKHDKNLQLKGFTAATSLFISSGATYTLKQIFNRDRPSVTYPFIQNTILKTGPSFPSGHTNSAFSTATSLTLAFPKWYVALPAYTWASTVAYSRLHLGIHYPSDVLAGAVVGAGSAWLCYKANRWLQKRNPQPLKGRLMKI